MSEVARYSITSEDKTGPGIKSAEGRFQSFGSTVSKLAGPLLALAGVSGFGALIGQALKAGDELQKLSLQTNITTEFLSEMQFVAERSGVAFKSLERALRTQSMVIGEAQNGARGYVDVLKRIGLESDDLIKMRPEDAFLRIGEALRGLENDTERAAVAQKIFGGRASEVLKITQQGAGAIQSMREEAQKFGLSLSGEQANAMATFADAMTNLQAAFKGFTRQLAGEAAPVLTVFADLLTTVIAPALNFVLSIVNLVIGGFKVLGGVAAATAAVFTGEFKQAGSILGLVFDDLVNGFGKAEKSAKTAAKNISETLGSASPVAGELAELSRNIEADATPSRPAAQSAQIAVADTKRDSADGIDRLVALTTEQVRLLTQIAQDGRTGGAVLG